MKIYMARQPILDRQKKLWGYELLYRDSDRNSYASDVDGSYATRTLISDAVVTIGMDKLVDHKPAFVNFTRSLLLSRFPFLLHSRDFVLEILENTAVDQALLEQLKLLKEKNYTLALDDYTGNPLMEPLMDYADIIKVDFRLVDPPGRSRIARKYRADKKLLAEKVETEEEFLAARRDGYTLFQGFLFSKPVMVAHHSMDIASATYLRLWAELSRTVPDYDAMAGIIRHDVNLSYKFLQKINTMAYYRGHRVDSIEHVLVRMGLNEIRRWILLVLTRDIAGAGSDELIRMALVRGTLAEKVMGEMGYPGMRDAAYTLGLFSAIDEEHRATLPELLKLEHASQEFEGALKGERNILTQALDFVLAFEAADWDTVLSFAEEHRLESGVITSFYLEAIEYADRLFGSATAQDSRPIASNLKGDVLL